MKHRKLFVLILFVALVGFSGTYYLYHLAETKEISQGKSVFLLQNQHFLFLVKERIAKNRLILSGIRSLFASSDAVSSTEWNTYYQTLDLTSQFPAVEFLSFVKYIPKGAEEKELQRIRSEGLPNFKIWPSLQNQEVCPIVYIQPEPYLSWAGYDICQNPAVYAAARLSAEKFEMVLAPAFSLSKVETKKSDFTLWFPIYNPKGAANSILGWAMSFLRFEVLIKEAMNGAEWKNTNLKVYLGSTSSENDLIFASVGSPDSNPLYTETKTLDLAGSKFTFLFESGPAYKLEVNYSHPRLLFFLSSSAMLLFLFILYYVGSHKGKSLLGEQSDIALLMRQVVLDNANYSIICTDKQGLIVLFNKAAEKLLGYSAEELVGKQTPVFFHDPEELKTRAQQLTNLLGRPVPAGMETFTTMADKGIPNENTWIYIRKDQTRVTVTLSITPVKTPQGELIGYMGIAHEAK
jgi:PAS domain S-box-containing protein